MSSRAFINFSGDLYSPGEIYDLLVQDLARDGKRDIRPGTLFTEDPPAGMGYGTLSAAQQFVQAYVNSTRGRRRYNVAVGNTVRIQQIKGPRNVGNLAVLIAGKQVVL